MPAPPAPAEALAPRISANIDVELRDWLHSRLSPAGEFASEGHAMELAAQRFHGEEDFVRQECKRRGLTFNAAAFWRVFQDLIDASRPAPGARPTRDGERSAAERARIQGTIDPGVVERVNRSCGPKGPFVTPSHAYETYLRRLRAQEPAERVVPGLGFPFNGNKLVAAYLRELENSSKRA